MIEWIKEAGKILPENPDFKRRLFCFIGSVLFHAVVLFLIVTFFSPVEFRLYEKVADVIIAPPLKLPLSAAERMLTGEEESSGDGEGRSAGQNPSGKEGAAGTERDLAELPLRALKKRAESKGGVSSLPPDMVSHFRLDPPREEKSGFTLHINPDENKPAEPGGELPLDALDLQRHIALSPSLTRPLRSYHPGKSGAGISSRSLTPAGQAAGYDLTPWAEGVVARIQRNWDIPSIQGEYEKRSVEITVVIDKSGEILSLRIRNSSSKPYLDTAALNAIKMSTPFPALPGDFPLDRLEADFLFQYYE
ncbi:MAG: TonB C-terminal domain-containing protein [Candidatus Aminicenantes bacterium]|nr:TonB C-terminal domain-containing protein [Candidatus Aminicenantes bacterium]